MIDLNELKKLASCEVCETHDWVTQEWAREHFGSEAEAKFVAACSPAAIRELIAMAEASASLTPPKGMVLVHESAAMPGKVAEGWQLVPIEPPIQFSEDWQQGANVGRSFETCYANMLAAARARIPKGTPDYRNMYFEMRARAEGIEDDYDRLKEEIEAAPAPQQAPAVQGQHDLGDAEEFAEVLKGYSIVARAIEMVDGCMDVTMVEPEDAAAWQIVRKHFATKPSPAVPPSDAPELSDAQIAEIADDFKFKDHWQSNAEAIRFARRVIAAMREAS